jgi:hypothetical protein
MLLINNLRDDLTGLDRIHNIAWALPVGYKVGSIPTAQLIHQGVTMTRNMQLEALIGLLISLMCLVVPCLLMFFGHWITGVILFIIVLGGLQVKVKIDDGDKDEK